MKALIGTVSVIGGFILTIALLFYYKFFYVCTVVTIMCVGAFIMQYAAIVVLICFAFLAGIILLVTE